MTTDYSTALIRRIKELNGTVLRFDVNRRPGTKLEGKVLWARTVGNNETEYVTHVWFYNAEQDRVDLFWGHYLRNTAYELASTDYESR